ncbi:hypothetical protein [Lysinibacillus xylanilyticus]|uniref:hypothetical protein n=1 Tax=Lysinibacillus xylanilyticus TaxID=582475 RepID=UPI003D0376C1
MAFFIIRIMIPMEGHSGFYSPPEKDDSLHLAFPTHREEAAVVRHSVRKGGDSNPKTADPKTSYWGTPKGKDIKLDQQAVTFTCTGRRRFPKAGSGKGSRST